MDTTIKTAGMITLAIDGMTCAHCVQAVTKALSAVPGVKVRSVEVGSAVIEAADGLSSGQALAALEAAGYPAKAVAEGGVKESGVRAGGGGSCCQPTAKEPESGAGRRGGCC